MNNQDKIIIIKRAHPPLNEQKNDMQIERLIKMADYYNKRVEENPDFNSRAFQNYIDALVYSITIIKMYRKLTKHIQELKSDDTDWPA